MFKPELWQSHDEHRTIVYTYRRRISCNPKYAFDLYDKERQNLLNLNLDPNVEIAKFYSAGGRPAKNQAQILRSLILFTLLFNKPHAKTRLILWVNGVLPNTVSLVSSSGNSCPYRDRCGRNYSAPDSGWGWDGDNKTWYFWAHPGKANLSPVYIGMI